ncbi:MAG: carbohydrate ABC transporter permease, partial [Sinomonas sp.]
MTTEAAPQTAAPRVTDDAPHGARNRPRVPQAGLAYSARGRARRAVKHVILIVAAIIMIYPLLWMVVSSFRPSDEVFRAPGLWLTEAHP